MAGKGSFRRKGLIRGEEMKVSYSTKLSQEDLKAAKELANMIRDIDSGRRVDPLKKQQLYAAISANPCIRYEALKINRERYRK